MGEVYRATQLAMSRTVALKLLSSRLNAGDPQFAQRFFLEAATLARLTHPNIVTVHDYGQSEAGDLFIVMELVSGRSLSELIEQEGPLQFERVVRLALQIARSLREAHAQGVIHRDLKPGNVMVTKGADEDQPDLIKVLDFGLVRLADDSRVPLTDRNDISENGSLIGSPKYMAPEQICCEPVDARTDIYSFGVLLYQLCAGVVPFGGGRTKEIIKQHLSAPVPLMASLGYGRTVPPALESIVMRCLEKAPDQRFASMNQLVGELKGAEQHLLGRRSNSGVLPPFPGSGALTNSYSDLSIETAANPLPPLQSAAGEHTVTQVDLEPPAFAVANVPQQASRPPRVSAAQAAAALAPPLVVSQPVVVPAAEGKSKSVVPWVVAGAAVAALVGVVMAQRAAEPQAPVNAPAMAVAPVPAEPVPAKEEVAVDEARVTFDSEPRGAKVEEKGVVLGVTPFILAFPRTEPDFYRVFIFRLDGHHPTTVQTPLATSKVTVRATLEARKDGRNEDAAELAQLRRQVDRLTANRRPSARAEVEPRPVAPEPAAAAAVAVAPVVDAPEPKSRAERREERKEREDRKEREEAKEAKTEAPSLPPEAPVVAAPEPAPKPVVEEVVAPAQPMKPKNVPANQLEKLLVERTDVRLPPNVLLHHQGQKVRIVTLVCVGTDGKVDPQHSRVISAPPGAGDAVLASVKNWRYRAPPVPLCAPVHLLIDVLK
jgi:serine/threonine-protein kinase